MGKHQLRLLKFALRFPSNWHTYGTDPSIVSAINSLSRMGLLDLNEYRQFRIRMAQNQGE